MYRMGSSSLKAVSNFMVHCAAATYLGVCQDFELKVGDLRMRKVPLQASKTDLENGSFAGTMKMFLSNTY